MMFQLFDTKKSDRTDDLLWNDVWMHFMIKDKVFSAGWLNICS